MNSSHLNEHDANQGAQSKGEFLGMSGNSAWYLLGASGASIMIVIVLWGVLGLSLLLCLTIGLVLCGLSVSYVFLLKNNRPEHYDTDFFESALVEAGVLELAFGPRNRRPGNPFRVRSANQGANEEVSGPPAKHPSPRGGRAEARFTGGTVAPKADIPASRAPVRKSARKDEEAATVSIATYERLQGELSATQELLEEAVAAQEEDRVCD